MVASADVSCPCGGIHFRRCCGRYLGHFDDVPAPDAQSLMRSRYSAFVLLDRDYLLATWHPDRRPTGLDLDRQVKWLGLEVRADTSADSSHSQVEFVARYRAGGSGRAVRIHERSRFVKENGRWFYLDGDML
ncbi:MAG: YchJ family metal-binding protein [Variovorax sp.]